MKELYFEEMRKTVLEWLNEDDLSRNLFYSKNLPDLPVKMKLKIKSDMILSGVDYFVATFDAIGFSGDHFKDLYSLEGKKFYRGDEYEFEFSTPFKVALTAERLALNLLQHSSSISTFTNEFVKKAQHKGIKILDTRKTTPGFRSLEKYAVRVGGGYNHRFGQSDLWMIKDNHKSCFGGLEGALNFFKAQGVFYQGIMAEIHDLTELKVAINLGINHLMLDNFSKEDIVEAIKLKTSQVTYEVSGGVKLNNLEDYLIEGVDAISIGALTNSAPRVDLSLKFKPI
jgi:nicotinate-nucleotide pyrophosphorylase (carboxylating)